LVTADAVHVGLSGRWLPLLTSALPDDVALLWPRTGRKNPLMFARWGSVTADDQAYGWREPDAVVARAVVDLVQAGASETALRQSITPPIALFTGPEIEGSLLDAWETAMRWRGAARWRFSLVARAVRAATTEAAAQGVSP
jgi:hypothetical protein